MPSVQVDLRTIVALSIETIRVEKCFKFVTDNSEDNTYTKVLRKIDANEDNTLNDHIWRLADEVIDFFKILRNNPRYVEFAQRPDASLIEQCIDATEGSLNFVMIPVAVSMPYFYGILKPKNVETRPTKGKEYMGEVNKQDRFFVKLMRVGPYTNKGNLFEVEDRNGNIGFFYEYAEQLQDIIQLGNCFAILATPTRHSQTKDANKEKHTIFRSVEVVIDSILEGVTEIDPSQDETGGKFTRSKASF